MNGHAFSLSKEIHEKYNHQDDQIFDIFLNWASRKEKFNGTSNRLGLLEYSKLAEVYKK